MDVAGGESGCVTLDAGYPDDSCGWVGLAVPSQKSCQLVDEEVMSEYVGREHRAQRGFIPRSGLWFRSKTNTIDVETRVGDRVWEISQDSPRCAEPIDAYKTSIAGVQDNDVESREGSEELLRQCFY